ncbi:MAG: hypothetical protein AB1921_04025 [Thermodesulfobacteriota bacterium]
MNGEKVTINGLQFVRTDLGLIYSPAPSLLPRKHDCPDCMECAFCSNARCDACRAQRKGRASGDGTTVVTRSELRTTF